MELWIRRREREKETGKEPEKLEGLKATQEDEPGTGCVGMARRWI